MDAASSELAATPADVALTAAIVRDLAAVPDMDLTAALQESARRFQSLLSCVSGTFYRCDLSAPWEMIFVSPGVEAISGYPPETFLQDPFRELIDPEDLPALDRKIELAIAARADFTACYRLHHRSGEIRWISEKGAVVCDEDGQPQFLEGFLSDVTAAKTLEIEAEKARQEIVELNDQMAQVLQCSLESITSLDRDWNYRFINRASALNGDRKFDVRGQNVIELYPDIVNSTAWPMLKHAMEQRKAVRGETYAEDSGKWYDIHVVPDSGGITAFYRDITASKQLETALFDRAAELRSTLDSIPYMVWTTHPNGRGDYYNKSWSDFVGPISSDAGRTNRTRLADWVHAEDRERAFALWQLSLTTCEPFAAEMRLRHHSGEYRWISVRCWPQHDEDGQITKWCGAATDIHERVLAERHLRESEHLQTNIFDASTDSIQILDLEGGLLFINAASMRSANLDENIDYTGVHWSDVCPSESWSLASNAFRRAAQGKVSRFVESSCGPSGRMLWWDVIVSPICATDGTISKILCTARDITDQRKTADRLRVASEQDVLTGLPNRRAFEKHLKKITARAAETCGNVGLMLIDLDHFKHINDTLGHLAGDRLLQVVAKRLRNCIGDSGFVARLGGDEFAVVISGLCEEQELIDAATRVLTRMEAPVTFTGKLINGGLSIGCAMFPRDAEDSYGLLKHADTALYDLKASGRGGVQMFNSRMTEAAERTANQLTLARAAIRDDAVEPYYQPKVRLESGEISGFEALLRWWSPGNGIQLPSSVAEAFNDYELSTKIGGLMQSRVFADIATWLDQGLDLPAVSINAAPAEFLRDDYAERLLDRLSEFDIPSSLIEVEITEHVFLERRSEHVVRALELLKQAGVRIALDDFGTGHSSLSHLRDFPVDVLKIDRSFVSRMLTKPRMLAIVQAITKLGPSLSLDIVAEGVETPEQLEALRDAGCEFGQGYLFGKAMHSAEVGRRLTTASWPFKLQKPA